MTVPTAGNRTALLADLVSNSGLPSNQIIVIATRPGVRVPQGVILIEDLGVPNIQRWWNRGIDEAQRRGSTHVAVVNDDVVISRETLPRLMGALDRTGAAIASPSRHPFRNGLHRKVFLQYEPRLWGSLWMLRLASGLRPDERYHWWYGDNDLDIRARRHFGGVALVDVMFDHLHPGIGLSLSPQLQEFCSADASTFESQYAWLLRRSRVTRAFLRRMGSGPQHD